MLTPTLSRCRSCSRRMGTGSCSTTGRAPSLRLRTPSRWMSSRPVRNFGSTTSSGSTWGTSTSRWSPAPTTATPAASPPAITSSWRSIGPSKLSHLASSACCWLWRPGQARPTPLSTSSGGSGRAARSSGSCSSLTETFSLTRPWSTISNLSPMQ